MQGWNLLDFQVKIADILGMPMIGHCYKRAEMSKQLI